MVLRSLHDGEDDPHRTFLSDKVTYSVAQEPEVSSQYSQQPATGPCPEPVESNPHPPNQSPQDPF
jgi:hypothetical protein